MDFATVQHMLALLLALAFAGGAAANLAGPAPMRQAYRDWGYPEGFHYVAGTLNGIAAGLLFWEPGRPCGAALALMITLAALATLGWHRQWSKTPASFVFIALLALLLL